MENYDLENLGRVLQRIAPSAQPEPEPEIPCLRDMIRQKSAQAAMYTLLALKTKGGPVENVFQSTARDERRHEKMLQTEFFLLTGDTCPPCDEQPSAPYLLEAVRKQYIEEVRSAENYERAAKDSPSPRSSALYSQIAADERRHAAAMRALVERLID